MTAAVTRAASAHSVAGVTSEASIVPTEPARFVESTASIKSAITVKTWSVETAEPAVYRRTAERLAWHKSFSRTEMLEPAADAKPAIKVKRAIVR